MNKHDWLTNAACAQDGTNPEWWFSKKDSPEWQKAIHICNETCPVKHQCTTYTALADTQIAGGVTGIWAGSYYSDRWRSAEKRGRNI